MMTRPMVAGPTMVHHDRDTVVPDRATAVEEGLSTTLLRSALERLRPEGVIFLRAEFRQPRAYQSLTGPETT